MSAMQEMQAVLPSPSKLFTPGVTVVLVLSVAGFVLYAVAPGLASGVFGLSADGVVGGRVWQLLTYPFVSDSAMNLVFGGLMILFVGSAVERQWQTSSFLWLWFVISFCCGILWVVVSLLLRSNPVGMGATVCTYGLIATMGLLYRGQRFLLFFVTVEAHYMVIGLIVIGILLSLAVPMTLIWIAGAPVAYLYVKAKWRLAAGRPRRPTPQSGSGRPIELD